jgi:Fanconi anemia group I protein
VGCARSSAFNGNDPESPNEQAAQLGLQVLAGTFRYHEATRRTILSRIVTSVIMRSTELRHDLALLKTLTTECLAAVLQNIAVIKEAMEYMTCLELGDACEFLASIQPLLRARPDLRDYAILILRKAIFNRDERARCIAVAGFLQILSASTSTASEPRLGVVSSDTQLFDDSMGFLRRSLGQQRAVRICLYRSLPPVFKNYKALRMPIIELIVPVFERHCESRHDTSLKMPFKIDRVDGSSPEPFDELLECLQRIIIVVDSEESEENEELASETNDARNTVNELLKSLLDSSPEHFDLDNRASFDASDAVGRSNVETSRMVARVYERMLEYRILTAPNLTEDVAGNVMELFDKRQQFQACENFTSSGGGGSSGGSSSSSSSSSSGDSGQKKNGSGHFTCPVCTQATKDPCASQCGHVCCRGCWKRWLTIKEVCPCCKAATSMSQIIVIKS